MICAIYKTQYWWYLMCSGQEKRIGSRGQPQLAFKVVSIQQIRPDPVAYSLYSLKLRMIMSEIIEIILQRKRIDDFSE